MVAVAVGYTAHNRRGGMLVSGALRPLLGRFADGWVGIVIDTLAVLAILFGIATSLGLGTGELNAGLAEQFGIADSYGVKIAIVAGLMTFATISSMTGLGRGIRMLSLVNFVLCGVLLAFAFLTGPTASILSTLGTGVVDYVSAFVPMSLATEGAPGDAWTREWIAFFWAWWIEMGSFVGTFIARISRGRTIRGVVTGVVLVPSLVSVVWFSVFGGTSLERELSGAVSVADRAEEAKSSATLVVFDTPPLTGFLLVLLVPVLALLFITSADSASFMLGSTTSGREYEAAASDAADVVVRRGLRCRTAPQRWVGQSSRRCVVVVAAAPFTVILLGPGHLSGHHAVAGPRGAGGGRMRDLVPAAHGPVPVLRALFDDVERVV